MPQSSSQSTPPELEKFRAEIDALDQELMDVIARRFEVVRRVGEYKAKAGLSVVQPERARLVIERAERLAAGMNVDPQFARKLYEMMIDTAHAMEHKIAERHAPREDQK